MNEKEKILSKKVLQGWDGVEVIKKEFGFSFANIFEPSSWPNTCSVPTQSKN